MLRQRSAKPFFAGSSPVLTSNANPDLQSQEKSSILDIWSVVRAAYGAGLENQ